MFCILSFRKWYLAQEDTYKPKKQMNNKITRHLLPEDAAQDFHQFKTFSYKKFGQQFTSIGLVLMNANFSVEIIRFFLPYL